MEYISCQIQKFILSPWPAYTVDFKHYCEIRTLLWGPGIVNEGNKITKNELFPEDGTDFFRVTVKNYYLLIFVDYMEVCL